MAALAGLGLFSSIVGLGASSLGIGSFLASNLAAKVPQGPTIKLKIGNQPTDSDAYEGDIEKIYTYNTEDQEQGSVSGDGTIQAGDVWEVTVDSAVAGEITNYVTVAASDNAVCIAWIGVSQYDGSDNDGSWNGDIGAACGQRWYFQNDPAGSCPPDTPDNEVCSGGKWFPRCTWLDANGDADIPSKSMKFNVWAYSNQSTPETNEKDLGCAATLWGKETEVVGTPEGATAPVRGKRSVTPAHGVNHVPGPAPAQKEWMARELVVSEIKAHNATSLCTSETSWGSDFCDNNTCCDMATKTAHPKCSSNPVDGCMEIDDKAKTMKKRSTVAKREVMMDHKQYNHIKRWTH